MHGGKQDERRRGGHQPDVNCRYVCMYEVDLVLLVNPSVGQKQYYIFYNM